MNLHEIHWSLYFLCWVAVLCVMRACWRRHPASR
jgi:hypothetical protein